MPNKLKKKTVYSLSEKAPERPDRRSDERYVSLLRVGALTIQGRRELCLIRNVSAGGIDDSSLFADRSRNAPEN